MPEASREFTVRPAVPADVRAIRDLVEPYANRRILIAKDQVAYYEAVQELVVAVDADGTVVGCGALHVMWVDLAEIRTLAVDPGWVGAGVGHAILDTLIDRARALGLARVFCLTFEVDFFTRHGFVVADRASAPPAIWRTREFADVCPASAAYLTKDL